jgi:hypothetical protein
VQHRRVLRLRPGKALTIRDRLDGAQAHSFTQWFHLAPGLTPTRNADGLTVIGEDGTRLRIAPPADAEIALRCGCEDPMQGWISESYGERAPRWSVGFTLTGSSVDLRTGIALLAAPAGGPRLSSVS